MKKRALIILFVYLLSTYLFAGWEHTYGGIYKDEGLDIIPSISEGYILTGLTESYGEGDDDYPDVYLFKIDSNGDVEWLKTYGYSDETEQGTRLIQLEDSYILSGELYSPENASIDLFLMKISESGDSLWIKYYGGTDSEELEDIIQTADGGFLLLGQTYSFGAGSFGDAYIVKTDSLGNALWIKRIGQPAWLESAYSAVQTPDGGFIISMVDWELGIGYEDLILLKLDNSGDSLWVKRYAGPYHDWGNKIIETSDGNYLLSGAYGTATYFYDWWLLKINNSGDTLWTKTHSGWQRSRGEDIKLLPDGGFIAINSAESAITAEFDIWVSRLNCEGDTLWNSYFGGEEHDLGESVITTPDGGFIIAGAVSSFGAGDYDCFVAKLDSLGHSDVEEKKRLPIESELIVSPNPFNSSVEIHVSLPDNDHEVDITIIDINGREVRELLSKPANGNGDYIFRWDGKDKNGLESPTGVYYYRMTSGNQKATGTLLLAK